MLINAINKMVIELFMKTILAIKYLLFITITFLIAGCEKQLDSVNRLVNASTLPSCDQSDTLKTVEEIVNEMPAAKAANAKFISLKNISEQGHNKESEIRACEAILVTTKGGDNFQYSIRWQDQSKTNYYVEGQVISNAQENSASTIQDITNAVATDMVERYEMAKRNSAAPLDICVQAGLVTAGFLQAKNEENYKKWKDIEKADCAAAGIQKG